MARIYPLEYVCVGRGMLSSGRSGGGVVLWFCCATNTLLITALEFVTGCLVNLHLGWDVWDYATQPLNLMGQVCIGFSALWFLLSVPVSGLSLAMLQGLQKRMMFAKTEG